MTDGINVIAERELAADLDVEPFKFTDLMKFEVSLPNVKRLVRLRVSGGLWSDAGPTKPPGAAWQDMEPILLQVKALGLVSDIKFATPLRFLNVRASGSVRFSDVPPGLRFENVSRIETDGLRLYYPQWPGEFFADSNRVAIVKAYDEGGGEEGNCPAGTRFTSQGGSSPQGVAEPPGFTGGKPITAGFGVIAPSSGAEFVTAIDGRDQVIKVEVYLPSSFEWQRPPTNLRPVKLCGAAGEAPEYAWRVVVEDLGAYVAPH